MIKLGSHISFKAPHYLEGVVEESINNGANVAMIYMGAPQNTKRAQTEKYKLQEYLAKYSNLIPPEDIIVHAPYITNPAKPQNSEFAINFLIEEIKRMNFFGAKYLVLHPGAHTKWTKEQAYAQLNQSLKKILKKTKNVHIILETMAGKGSEIGTKIEELVQVIENIDDSRLGICLDTCHVWDAGYDITKLNNFLNYLQKNNYLKYIKVIHLNDSKNPLGASKDRHENIGKGYIGFEALQKIVHHKIFDNIPIILETPWIEGKSPYKDEIKQLLSV